MTQVYLVTQQNSHIYIEALFIFSNALDEQEDRFNWSFTFINVSKHIGLTFCRFNV
jgi:hypothetical protein